MKLGLVYIRTYYYYMTSIILQVFGGIECQGASVVVESQDTATLLSIIKNLITPGSTILPDCWKAYDCLEQHGHQHVSVNHSKNLKDPVFGAHTNTIEGS